VSSGTLPDGWRLDSLTGIAAGVARAAGTFTATVQAVAPDDTATATLRWTILPALELGEAPWGRSLALGAPRLDTLSVFSRAGTPAWRVSAGALPAGIILTTDGILRGTPTTSGPYSALLEVRAGAATRTLALAGLVERVPLRALWATTDTVLVQGEVALDSVRLLDGDGSPVTLSLSADSLPPGLTFDAARRLLFGRPRTVGTWRVPITVTQGVQRFELVRTLRITPLASLAEDSLPTATTGFTFTHVVTPTVRGSGTVTVREGATRLPGGLVVSADGRISGIPDTLGSGASTLLLDVTRPDGQYEVPWTVRWTVREATIDAGAVFDALLGIATLGPDPLRGLDLLGNRNQRLDVGDVLRWLVRRGVLSPAASTQEVMPALERMMRESPSLKLETPGTLP